MEDLPRAVDALIHLGRIPSRRRLGTVAHLCSVIDEIEGEHGDVPALLDFRVDHLDPLDFDLAGERRDVLLQGRLAVDPLLRHGIEVGLVRRHDFEEPLRITFAPTIEGGPLHRDDRLCRVALHALQTPDEEATDNQ